MPRSIGRSDQGRLVPGLRRCADSPRDIVQRVRPRSGGGGSRSSRHCSTASAPDGRRHYACLISLRVVFNQWCRGRLLQPALPVAHRRSRISEPSARVHKPRAMSRGYGRRATDRIVEPGLHTSPKSGWENLSTPKRPNGNPVRRCPTPVELQQAEVVQEMLAGRLHSPFRSD